MNEPLKAALQCERRGSLWSRFSTAAAAPLLLLVAVAAALPLSAGAQVFSITRIANTNVQVGTLVTIPVTLTNTTGASGSQLFWTLNSSPTTDATLSSTNTVAPEGPTTFTWRPLQAQTADFTITVIQPGTLNSSATAFSVTATNAAPVDTAPVLSVPFTQTNVLAGTAIAFAVYATNTDNSTGYIKFSLDPTPGNASITNGAVSTIATATTTNGIYQGLFAWTTAASSAGSQTFNITATQTNTALSVSKQVTIKVLLNSDCPQVQSEYDQFLAAVAAGGRISLTNCPTLVLSNTLVVSNSLVMDAPGTNVTIAGTGEFPLFTVLSNATLTLNGLSLRLGAADSGGALYIMAGATGVLNSCTFAGNLAVGTEGEPGDRGDNDANYGQNGHKGTDGWPGVGGAVLNLGTLSATGCLFTNNTASGGSGGAGGNGGNSGNNSGLVTGGYRGGNGGDGGNGALAFGGAIYSTGTLALTNCTFAANVAYGGSGGDGGTNGTGVFASYPGTGGSGAEGSGGAVYSTGPTILNLCTFTSNSAQGGDSATAGERGGGYGVKGKHGGASVGGAVCLLGPGLVANCTFTSDTATGGKGGDGGPGRYSAGDGGNGGEAIGGCLYNYAGATVLDCTFANCQAVGGANGVAGTQGVFRGRDGQPANSSTNTFNNTTNPVVIAGLPAGALPAALAVAGVLGGSAVGAPAAASGAIQTQAASGDVSKAASAAPAAPASPAAPGAAVGLPAQPGPAGAAAPAPSAPPAGAAAKSFAPVTPAGGAGAPGASAQSAVPGAAAGDEMLPQGMIDFRSADLNQVLEIYSDLVKRTILRPATLPAPTITLTTRGQLTVKEGIQALEAVLALNGISMINIGEKFVKALPEAQGNTAGAAFNTNSATQLPELGQYVTHVVQLKYSKPSELVAILQPFIKIPNAILPIDSSQMLVLRDYAENVKRMLELIKTIDVVVPSEYVSEVIPIKYAQATEIANALNSLSTSGGGATVGGTGGAAGTTRTTGTSRMGLPGQTAPGMVTPPGAAGTPTPAPARTGSFSERLQNIINRASSQGEIQVLGQTKIIADERTNSLLIYASRPDMKTIKDIVSKLDVVLAQVLIEAVIIEVTLADSKDVGFNYLQHPQNSGQWTGVGAINTKNFLSVDNFSGINGVTNSGGVLPSGFSYLMSWGQDLDVTVTAAASDSRAKILQKPRIQTSHNEPASLFVGESRPYPTSSYYGGGAYGGYSSIQQLQIGVTLEVTPLINPDGLVVMEIHQRIESFAGNVTIQNVGDVPVTRSKEAAAKVSVRDHDTIILGGLIETDKASNNSGVPFLMDLPLLGYLFRSSHSEGTRKEVMVLIRPTVLPTPEVAALAATAEKNKMPGIRATEREMQADETQRLKKENKAGNNGAYESLEKP